MTTIQEKLFNKIKELSPQIEREEKKESGTTTLGKKEYILFNGNKINFYNFKAHLDTIQKRNYLNRFCLYEISKDCENRQLLNREEKQSLVEEDASYHPSLIVQCEYFMFSIKSIFDTILKMITYLVPEKEHKGFGQIETWGEDALMKELIGEHLDWVIKFNNLRNRLTHDTIAELSMNFNHNCKSDILTYSKRNLSIRKKDEQLREIFQLPDYFDECFLKTNEIINKFYNFLIMQKIEGK